MNFPIRAKVTALTETNIVTAALFVQFLASVAFNLMGSFMPLFINAELDMSLIDATYWTGVSVLVSSSVMALSAPFWGWMCDKFGTKRIMLIVLSANAVVFAGMAFSVNVMQIILFRGLQGAFGGLSTVMFALAVTVAPPAELRKVLSYQIAAMTIGGLVAPGIGGALAATIGYRLTLAASALLFVVIFPFVSTLSLPRIPEEKSNTDSFTMADFKSLLPDSVALILVYICISFIVPVIPWFLQSLGIPDDQLLTYTTIATVLNGAAYAAATPVLTNRASGKALPLLSVGAALAIQATAFAFNPLFFIALRVAMGAIQAGIPPNLLGGRSGRKGTGMGFLNSARFIGMALGPFLATSILGEGTPVQSLYMYTAMAATSLASAVFLYLTHVRKASENEY